MIIKTKPTYVFFFGDQKTFKSLALKISHEKLDVRLASTSAMLGRTAFELPSSISKTLILSYPSMLPNAENFSELTTLLLKSKSPMRSPVFQALALASAKTFVEAVKHSERQIGRCLAWITKGPGRRRGLFDTERVMGFEPTISCLGSKRSTTELHPHFPRFSPSWMNTCPNGTRKRPHLQDCALGHLKCHRGAVVRSNDNVTEELWPPTRK